jgi:hypothetical protein
MARRLRAPAYLTPYAEDLSRRHIDVDHGALFNGELPMA